MVLEGKEAKLGTGDITSVKPDEIIFREIIPCLVQKN